MKCKLCGNYVRLLRSGAVATHKDGENICPASGVVRGHRDHPDPLIAPDLSWEPLGRGYVDWPEPDQTYGAAD